MTGPVQVLVVGFEAPSFSGEVVGELNRLSEAGIVRLIDVLLVARAEDGSLDTLPPPPGADPGLGRLAAEFLEVHDEPWQPGEGPGLEGVGVPTGEETGEPGTRQDDVAGASWSLDDAVPPGGIAAVALVEHRWAEPLVGAIRRAGGRPLDETWLAADEVDLLDRLAQRRATDAGEPSV